MQHGARVNHKLYNSSLITTAMRSCSTDRDRCDVVRALLSAGCTINESELVELGNMHIALENKNHWLTAIEQARWIRAKQYTKAIAEAAPVPIISTGFSPMDLISLYAGFSTPLE